MAVLSGKRVLLGVTGGIAAYKAADAVRRLREAGAEVRVVMTRGATELVGPLTFQALSGHPVRCELWDPAAEGAMGHIELARWADAVLVAPATANFMARLAQGLADDLLATLCLATEAPLALAPAMNRVMWASPATQANRRCLEERGVRLLGPDRGGQACGESGEGRMVEPAVLVEAVAGLFRTGALAGERVLITAGPTREPIDPVRYVGNRSSGRMGFALARAAQEAGAAVTLVSGPVALATPERVERIDVETAAQMQAAVEARVGACEIFIGAAAVADYRPAEPASRKIKKAAAEIPLRLLRNPDIIAAVAARPHGPFTVGFAAETDDPAGYARRKLREKGLDMIAANRVGAPGEGFESATNALEVLWPDGRTSLARDDKERLARRLIALVAERYRAARAPAPAGGRPA